MLVATTAASTSKQHTKLRQGLSDTHFCRYAPSRTMVNEKSKKVWLAATLSASAHLRLRDYSAQVGEERMLRLEADDFLPNKVVSVRVGTLPDDTICWLSVFESGETLLADQLLRFECELFGDSAVKSTLEKRAEAIRETTSQVCSFTVWIKLAQLMLEDILVLDFYR